MPLALSWNGGGSAGTDVQDYPVRMALLDWLLPIPAGCSSSYLEEEDFSCRKAEQAWNVDLNIFAEAVVVLGLRDTQSVGSGTYAKGSRPTIVPG